MLLRIQSPDGVKRLEVTPTDTSSVLFEKILEAYGLAAPAFALYASRDRTRQVSASRSTTLSSLGLRHGDMLFLFPDKNAAAAAGVDAAAAAAAPAVAAAQIQGSKIPTRSNVQEEPVDALLHKMDGKIKRKRDPKTCLHCNDNSSCLRCLPLEPYDAAYLEEQKIKFMSFHAYLRKLSGGLDGGKFAHLDDISCHIKPGCTSHPPWPRGVCSKCQPKAITLNRQVYRHVDHVVIENPNLVERFLHYWRATGRQRIGFLYGRYEVHSDVPLGIKGVVSAIYEPPQESTRDSVRLLEDPRQELVERLARQLELQAVGWIFTDLVTEDAAKGTVRHFRHADTHFLSAQECIMAGHLQSQHPNPCRWASAGHFGSKFVTICVTGDQEHQVHMEGYQVSNQCQALVRDGCLVPTKDAPELGYVRQSTNDVYVPDVYYKEKDTYGNEVTRMARPLPVEYLLVDLPVSTPRDPVFKFYFGKESLFPVENRPISGHLQDVSSLASYLNQFPRQRFLQAASDFHFLLYIATMDMLPLWDCMDQLLEAVRTQNAQLADEWAQSDQWSTVEQLLAHADHSSIAGAAMEHLAGGGADSGRSASWTCAHCTYINPPTLTSCEICNLPQRP